MLRDDVFVDDREQSRSSVTEQQFGRYRLLSLLGRGGMGEVWRAVDTEKDREVALKVLGSWLNGDPRFAERFRRESALAARLSSPHIVPIHDYGEIDGRLYIDMALIEGTDLAALLEQGPLSPERAVGIVAQVGRALTAAHRADVVHRDVKPSNIVISTEDGADHAYLIDFGITRALDGTRLTLSGAVTGTPAYMAPECFTGEGDARSDVYSLGCVLHEALTGKPPFIAPHAFAYGHLHQHEPPPRPSALVADLPPALDGVTARALAKDPADRYAGATELAAAARAALSTPPAEAGDAAAHGRPTVTAAVDPAPPTRAATATSDELRAAAMAPTHVPDRPAPAPSGAVVPRPGRRTGRRRLITALVLVPLLAVAVFLGSRATGPSGSAAPPAPGATRTPGATAFPTATPRRDLTITTSGKVEAVAATVVGGRPVVVAGDYDGAVRIFDLHTGEAVGGPLTGHSGPVLSVATTQLDGRPVAVTGGSLDDTVRIWDLSAGQEIGQPLTGHTDYVRAVAITQVDGRPVAVTGSDDKTLRIWDLATGRQVGPPLTGHTGPVLSVATTQLDGRPVAVTGSLDDTVRIWDLTTGRQVGRPLTGHTDSVYGVATTQLDGRPVAVSGSGDGTVRIWDLTTGRQVGQPLTGESDGVLSVATGQLDGRPVAVTGGATPANTVRIWDLAGGRQLGQPLSGHTGAAESVAVADADGRPTAVSGSDDHTVRTWDLLTAAGR